MIALRKARHAVKARQGTQSSEEGGKANNRDVRAGEIACQILQVVLARLRCGANTRHSSLQRASLLLPELSVRIYFRFSTLHCCWRKSVRVNQFQENLTEVRMSRIALRISSRSNFVSNRTRRWIFMNKKLLGSSVQIEVRPMEFCPNQLPESVQT